MSLTRIGCMLLGLVIAASPLQADDAFTPPEGFEPLFNGVDLRGWHGIPGTDPRELAAMSEEELAANKEAWMVDTLAHWTVENGEIVNDGFGPYLTTDAMLGDYELLIEYKTVPLADSGIYLRYTPQVQIWDWREEAGQWGNGANFGSGGLWNNTEGAPGKYPTVLADRPFGEWNEFRILQVGARTSVWMNGEHIVDHAIMENYWDRAAPLFREGPVQLQTHGGEIRWRNIYVREIGSDEANEILAANGNEGFEPIFNGENLAGWSGPVDSYEVVDGALRCKDGQGGTIFTDEVFSDFVARMEIKIPSGDNNGLAIRYPGEGDTAYVGMCELQVIDNDGYEGLDPRQAHGSAYGMVAAHQGFLRPDGEWNFQEVTVQGSTVKIELNGFVILNADLATVTEFLDNSPHPGKDLESGHFGFAGHGDPVEFRSVSIRRLDGAAE